MSDKMHAIEKPFFINKYKRQPDMTQKYDFKSKTYFGLCNELQNFENNLFSISKTVKFSNIKHKFQQKIKDDLNKIKSSRNVLVFADKTTNIYKMSL